MKALLITALCLGVLSVSLSSEASALRCKNDWVNEGDTKSQVYRMCGKPDFTDRYCKRALNHHPALTSQRCEVREVWTYLPGRGQLETFLHFRNGVVYQISYGDRI